MLVLVPAQPLRTYTPYRLAWHSRCCPGTPESSRHRAANTYAGQGAPVPFPHTGSSPKPLPWILGLLHAGPSDPQPGSGVSHNPAGSTSPRQGTPTAQGGWGLGQALSGPTQPPESTSASRPHPRHTDAGSCPGLELLQHHQSPAWAPAAPTRARGTRTSRPASPTDTRTRG